MRWIPGALPLLPLLLGCPGLERRTGAESAAFAEPDVFEVIRAGNSRAVLNALAAQHEEELQHQRILRESRQELLAGEEALAVELQIRRESFAALRRQTDEARAQADEQSRALAQAQTAQQQLASQVTESQAAKAQAAKDLAAVRAEIQKLEEEQAAAETAKKAAVAARDAGQADLERARKLVEESQRPDTLLMGELRALLQKIDAGETGAEVADDG